MASHSVDDGFPLLLGASRKAFIGRAARHTADVPAHERVHGSCAAAAIGVARGCVDMVRVHDVRASVDAVRVADAVWRAPL